MIFQPVIAPALLIVLFLPLLYITIRGILRAPNGARRVLWSERTLLVTLCLVMLMRPGLTGSASQTVATNTDVYLVVDTTASIVAEDWDGDKPRLDGIRSDVEKLVEQYPGARFSLITFASTAEIRLPLTTDTSALISSLAVLRPETTSVSKGSDIGAASSTLERTLKAAAEGTSDRSRMVFYFGDGEQTSDREPKSFAKAGEFVDGGAVFGYGTAEGGPMKVTSGLATDTPSEDYVEYNGEIALSVLDENNLKKIAEQLEIPLEVRSASTEPDFPKPPSTSTTLQDSSTGGGIFDLSWILALAVMVLVAFELMRATMLATQLRGLKVSTVAPGPTSQPRQDEGSPS